MDYKKLDAIVDSYREDILETMKRWIAIPSVQAPRAAENAPFGKETRRHARHRHGGRFEHGL